MLQDHPMILFPKSLSVHNFNKKDSVVIDLFSMKSMKIHNQADIHIVQYTQDILLTQTHAKKGLK